MTQFYMRRMHRIYSQLGRQAIILCFSTLVLALAFETALAETEPVPFYSFPSDYQELQLNSEQGNDIGFDAPHKVMSDFFSANTQATEFDIKKKIISLLNWVEHRAPKEKPEEPYQRVKQFGRWIRNKQDGCLNTRAKVLKDFSTVPVGFRLNNPCSVDSGQWFDPYSGKTFTKASDLQVDHVIPLKDAYINGAWKWSKKQRCAFANFKASKTHLIPVSKFENMSKGDRTPANYLPANSSYVCQYLKNWLEIKLIWNLEMTAPEASAIDQAIADYNCDARKLRAGYLEIRRTRAAISETALNCPQ